MNSNPIQTKEITYNDSVVRAFVIATLLWGIVAFLVGIIIAAQLAHWPLNFGLPWLTFGRLRPLHTNAAIFAFAGNAVFAGIYYSSQRLLKARMYSDKLSWIHFWGWQLIIVAAALTLPFGITIGKEYAELEWPIAWTINLVWVLFGLNFFMTIKHRREQHLYVAIWFYIATIITVALLHVVNSINLPVSLWKSYPVYAGVQDALVQWWYGHNAVAFFLTTPFLGLMYYFMPKAAEGPVYSYRLSIIHFWSLVFIYIWAGPHHLLYTALPEWAQTMGMVFSVMLWAPSWGGMINGLLTLRGSWGKLRTDPILKMFVAGLTFYGMSTFEGPLLSIKSVSALGHYTDWIIAHVHGGTLGWNGFMTYGMIYWLVPRLWGIPLYSRRLANAHFWLGTVGILLYMLAMYTSGITQGLMWRAIDETGKLVYPDFVQTVVRIIPLYWVRMVGGLFYLTGALLGVYNVWKTVRAAPKKLPVSKAVVPIVQPWNSAAMPAGPGLHRRLEALPYLFSVLTATAVLVGTVIELLPTFMSADFVEYAPTKKPYTGLQLQGRDIYIREGCYNCHSQMIRPLVAETLRYGEPSKPQDSMYDHPFQWGSKRTGPDLARIAGKYPDLWHFRHMIDPREVVPGSIMPIYTWLATDKTDFSVIQKKLKVMKTLGVPYDDWAIIHATEDAQQEAQAIAKQLEEQGAPPKLADKEIIPLIAYLQTLGRSSP